ncbi:DNA/RNA-binding domain of Phe-tRNA-synthetase-like protein [Dysgonomonas alginatilytica]|uniref:DNA/RNA-binding domain of Phe-tRNA-synthetase-like protein n=1 Tax=Dysgonomonas alginatilytica TaxID=1605892 RepID=A0A2V3PJQ5_9BACT|nr:phenylalanine--tRNA ligase beta subunit-related protein [Dysgonomonas alginatilytica]PXV58427.1 DNA/RNA-binding domain of Phe-tRNA-synthetase-like protein [Dysgonomonas alginatilytica]
MFTIKVSEDIRIHCPEFAGVAILATVQNTAHSEELWKEIDACIEEYRITYQIDNVKKIPAIEATRNAYKRLGKDPNRYRPSSEALGRRILRDLPLYQIDTLVDLINLVSIRTGYSIGGFDADKIEGNVLTLGVGIADEPYEAIGRGMLNIEGLPVYRDARGGVGTPTSDNERTKLDLGTTHFLAIINGYDGQERLPEAVDYMQSLLRRFTASDGGEVFYF